MMTELQGLRIAIAGLLIVEENDAYTCYLTAQELEGILTSRGAVLQPEVRLLSEETDRCI